MKDPKADFNAENLKPLVGAVFKITDSAGNQVEMTLSELNEDIVQGIECESFSAVFKGEKDSVGEQGLYHVAHEGVGSFQLMLSPNTDSECEAVISRLKGAAAEELENPSTRFNAKNLRPLVGEAFEVTDAVGNTAEVTLSELNEDIVKGVECESFAAIFTGEKDKISQQGIYYVTHKDVGMHQLMISPNSPTECEVVISRLTGDPKAIIEE